MLVCEQTSRNGGLDTISVSREGRGQVSSWGGWDSVLKSLPLGLGYLFWCRVVFGLIFCCGLLVFFFSLHNFVSTLQNVRTLVKGHTRLLPSQQLGAFSIHGKNTSASFITSLKAFSFSIFGVFFLF